MMKPNNLYKIWIGLLSIIIILGVFTTIKVLFTNSDDVFHVDDNIPWTLLIATYIFFVLTSTGATIVASLYSVFGFERFKPLEKRAIFIGIITLFAGFLAMGLELGNPLNMYYFLLTPNFSSPIFWMGFFYACLLVVLCYKFWQIHQHKSKGKFPKLLPVLAFVLEIGALSTLGSVFGLIEARPNFFGEYIQVYFLFTALLSGISALFFLSLITYKFRFGDIPVKLEGMYEYLSRLFGAVLGLCLLFSIWRVFIGLYANSPEFDVLNFMVQSFSYRIEIFVGLMIPLMLMIIPATRKTFWGKFLASVLVFIGLGIGRMELVMLGQMMPVIPKYQEHVEIITYFPTIWEWLIGAFALSLMLMLYTLGERYLNLDTENELTTN